MSTTQVCRLGCSAWPERPPLQAPGLAYVLLPSRQPASSSPLAVVLDCTSRAAHRQRTAAFHCRRDGRRDLQPQGLQGHAGALRSAADKHQAQARGLSAWAGGNTIASAHGIVHTARGATGGLTAVVRRAPSRCRSFSAPGEPMVVEPDFGDAALMVSCFSVVLQCCCPASLHGQHRRCCSLAWPGMVPPAKGSPHHGVSCPDEP